MINSNKFPLVSVIVLCYRNFRYVYDAKRSVLEQNDPKTVIVVSDDGSQNFPRLEIEKFVQDNKRENIVSVKIKHHDQNVGTVKHLNKAIALTSGEYVMSLSADDMIANSDVVTRYVQGLQKRPECDILMAQTAMYDEDMDELQYYFVRPHIRDILQGEQKDDTLLKELVQTPCLPSVSTFFKKTFFEKYGRFNEEYDLVEDWSLHLRIAREHIPIAYLDFPSIKHRSGGISHGNTEGTNSTFYRYLQDLNHTYLNDIKPYLNRVAPEIREKVEYRHRQDVAWIHFHYRDKQHGLLGMIRYVFSHPIIMFQKLATIIYHQCYGKAWNPFILALLFPLVSPWALEAFSISCAAVGWPTEIVTWAGIIITWGSGLLIAFSVFFLVFYLLSAIYCCVTEDMGLYF